MRGGCRQELSGSVQDEAVRISASSGSQGCAERAIGCEGISKAYDGVPVLRSIDVSFRPGTVNVFAGEERRLENHPV